MSPAWQKKIEEDAKNAHSMIDNHIALKWEYVEAYKAGATSMLPVIEVLMEALGVSEKAIEALTLSQKEYGMGLLGTHIVVPETLRRIQETIAKAKEMLGEK